MLYNLILDGRDVDPLMSQLAIKDVICGVGRNWNNINVDVGLNEAKPNFKGNEISKTNQQLILKALLRSKQACRS